MIVGHASGGQTPSEFDVPVKEVARCCAMYVGSLFNSTWLYTARCNLQCQYFKMNAAHFAEEIIAVYRKHGWQLRRVLLRPETRAEIAPASVLFDAGQVEEAAVDALWFSRVSHEGREAWELRLMSDNPYALFETFEKNEIEEQREEMRREMEARLREYVSK
jgi:hypothetical protein